MRTRPTPGGSPEHRGSIAVYRMILRCYPRAFREPWAGQILLLFAELARTRPGGTRSTIALWADHLPDLTRGLLAEWSHELARVLRDRSPAVTHGALAGVLLSVATIADNLGWIRPTPAGRAGSWSIIIVALAVLARTGKVTEAGPGTVRRSVRNGLAGGLIAFTSANLTATVIVITALDRLSHDSLQMTAFVASHEADFRTYQLHELLGGWAYGSISGALLGAVVSGITAAVRRTTCLERRES